MPKHESYVPGVQWWKDVGWIVTPDFVDLDFNRSDLGHVQGLTIDIENVLTDGIDGEDPTIRPEALEKLAGFYEGGMRMALLTNCTDVDFLDEVNQQVADIVNPDIPIITKSTLGKSKLSGEMFRAAGNTLRVRPGRMAHIDDQFKSHIGAIRASYATKIWTMPWGEHQHKGVERFRPFEMSVIRSLVRAYPRSRAV